MKKKYDYLFVGAGLFNAVLAYRATQAGKRCLVLERTNSIGGACKTHIDNDTGIVVHDYGPHIFHTSNNAVIDFVTKFANFNSFINSPIAKFRMYPTDKYDVYNLPFNMNTFYKLFGTSTPEEAKKAIETEKKHYLMGYADNLEYSAMSMVGKTIYERLVKYYTKKQWGRPCSQLPPDIIKRLPVRFTYDNNYFNASFQGIPDGGYSPMIARMFNGCDVVYGVNYCEDDARNKYEDVAEYIFYSGDIAELFCYMHGQLNYRTVRFETETLDIPLYQGNAVVNYTGPVEPYTRKIEHKLFNPNIPPDTGKTIVTTEYPEEWVRGNPNMFYPISTVENLSRYALYKSKLPEKYILTGRLGLYKYLDMDKVIEAALGMPLPNLETSLLRKFFYGLGG